ncbi:MAG: alpha/beta fold hydrolase [Gemmataceae bacterium]
MSRSVRTTWVLALGVAAWLLLGFAVSGASERFYLVLPPLALGVFLARNDQPRRWLMTEAPRILVFLVALVVVCAAFGLVWARASKSPLLRMAPEVLFAVYFLSGAVLLIGAVRSALRGAGRWLGDRCFGRAPVTRWARVGRLLVADVLPLLLLLNFTLAYLLAALYVHRFKMPNPVTPREALARSYEDVSFTTADGLAIRGWFIPAIRPSTKTVVICHGLGANRSMFLPCVLVADALDANALLFDFRGHGDSDGHTCSLGHAERLDVLAAVDYLRTERPEQARSLIGYGISMGSAALLRAAAELERPFDAVIVDSGFAAATDLTDSILVFFPAPLRPCLTGLGVPLASLHAGCWLPDCRPEDCMSRLRAPVLIAHGRGDPLIPSDHARRLYEHAREPKGLLLVDTKDHAAVLATGEEQYLHAVKAICKKGD